MSKTPNRIFVYGTLLGRNKGIKKITGKNDCRYLGRGLIRGAMYDLGEYPGVKRIGARDGHVHGEVYEITDFDEVVPLLDEYEETDPVNPGKGLFRRHLTTVSMNDGRKVRAFVYLYNRDARGLRRIPSGEWRDVNDRSQIQPRLCMRRVRKANVATNQRSRMRKRVPSEDSRRLDRP